MSIQALSNIAVPKYYGRFREAVIRGEIPFYRTQIIKCKACGADNTINEGETKYCEYCGQILINEYKKKEKC